MNDNLVEEIKSRSNIVDVIGRNVVLKKAGQNYKGLCPFHSEKTPSFVVSEQKQIFTCFGCGATGDVIQYIQRINNLDFIGALDLLADEYGIERKASNFESEQKKAILYDINREAAKYFYQNFLTKGEKAIQYMNNRGIFPGTLKKFGIGYATEGWTDLYDAMTAKGIDAERLLELGLISKNNGRCFDKFRNRIIFPIINTRGKVIGFGGRAIGDDNPKYLNSAESSIFMKKNNLYGLNLSREDINKQDYAILVEGYMDVIALYQGGITNVAASLGTALTDGQASLLKRYSRNTVLAYDSDGAGKAAAERGMEILYKEGCKVKILTMEKEKDPDEYIRKHGKDSFHDLIRKALPYAEYKISILKKQHDISTTEGRIGFLRAVATFLKTLSPMEADVYIQNIAVDTKISEGAIRREVSDDLDSTARGQSTKVRTTVEKPHTQTDVHKDLLEKNLIKLMLLSSRFIPKLNEYNDVFRNPVHHKLAETMRSFYRDDQEIDLNLLMDSLDQKEQSILQDIMDNIQIAGNEELIFADCISRIELDLCLRRQNEILQLLPMLDEEADVEQIEKMTKELMENQRSIQKIKRTVGETQ